MRLYVPILFLTLVLSGFVSRAAPKADLNPSPLTLSPNDKSDFIYSQEHTERNWSLRVGILAGAISETQKAAQVSMYGFRYDFLKTSLTSWQMEVMLGKDNFLHLVLGKKFYFPLETQTMPYYKFSLGNLIESTEGLGSIFNLKKMQAMAAVGLDDLFHWNQRLQGELAVSYALIGPQLEFSLGIAF